MRSRSAEPAPSASQRSSEEMADELVRTALAVVIDCTQLRVDPEEPPDENGSRSE